MSKKKYPRTEQPTICTKCKEEKDASEFGSGGGKLNGLRPQCKACDREYDAALNYPRTEQPTTCSKCKEEKDASEFGCKRHSSNGLNSQCKACTCEYHDARNYPRTDKATTCSKCKEEKDASEFCTGRNNKNGLLGHCKACTRETRVLRSYGIAREVHLLMLEAQKYACFCGTPLTVSSDIDHCHTTGKIRGILCQDCNRGLGLFRDNPDTLRKAADYLEAQRSWGYMPDST